METHRHNPENEGYVTQEVIAAMQRQREAVLNPEWQERRSFDLEAERADDVVNHYYWVSVDEKILDLINDDCTKRGYVTRDCIPQLAAEKWGYGNGVMGGEVIEKRLDMLLHNKRIPGADLPYRGHNGLEDEVPEWYKEHFDLLIEEAKPELAKSE